ncbi:MAG: LysR family transcriptional regulator, partial [Ideonella sp.]|nr:LysR family transcriptional regulator [Ideonella sp.]
MPNPLKNATLRQLATFQTLARLGSVSRTAQEMHLTQPAVSLQLGILEESAGTPLLSRDGRGVRLTAAGEILAGYADRIMALWREAGEAMAAQRGVVAGSLRVGVVTTAEYLLPQLLLDFVRQHDQVSVKLEVGNRAAIVAMLAQQDIDLAVMGRPPAELRVVAAPFARHPMAFVAAPHHPLAAHPSPTLRDLNGANLLLRERGSGTRTTVEQLYKAAGVDMRLGAELSSNEAI